MMDKSKDVPYEKTEYLVTGQGFNDITDNLEKSIKESFLGYKAIKDVDIDFENDEQMIFKFIVKEDVLADKELFNEMYVEGTLKELFTETNKNGIYIAKTECLDKPQIFTKEVPMETLYDFELEDDDKVIGGTAGLGETLAEFIADVGFEPDENGNYDLEKINQALYDCGIMPIKMENGEIHSIERKEETVKYAKARYGEEQVSVKVPKSELWNGNDKLLSALEGLRDECELSEYVDYPKIYIPRYMLGEYLREEVDINTFLYGYGDVDGYTEEDVEDLCDFIRENYPSYNLNEHSTFKEDTERLLENIKEEISLKEDKPKNKKNKGNER